jgi:AraC family transcriptional regulator, regulatory protein of adaptative response / methylated-DNA-[protein]-cysteine methyltransferase
MMVQSATSFVSPRPGSAGLVTDAARLAAVRRRDPAADGRFFYSVATTGVYCRPSCAARPARAENIAFHDSADAAEQAGFRPCKRCTPRGPSQREREAAIVASVRAHIEGAEEALPLEALAAEAGLSPFYLHRLFKKVTGLTPRGYAAAHRLTRVGDELRDGVSVTEAIHGAGYSSSSRFYEAESRTLGMLPSELRRGGEGVEMRAVVRRCSLGMVLVAATARGLCAVAFGDHRGALRGALSERFPRARVLPADDALRALADRVVDIVDAGRVATDLPLDLVGTAFQQRVWRALREVPAGQTTTYAAIAARIGSPAAVRAVGTACGQNPVAVVVPCHRAVRGDGQLGGYRWGVERKRALLEREERRAR